MSLRRRYDMMKQANRAYLRIAQTDSAKKEDWRNYIFAKKGKPVAKKISEMAYIDL